MAQNIKNFDEIIDRVNSGKISLLALGCFSYGVANYWLFARSMIKDVAKVKDKIDIFLEDPYPLTERLNKVINGKADMKLAGDYKYTEDHPLHNYVRNIGYDSTDFLQFLGDLEELNRSGKQINIYGVGPLLTKSDLNLIQSIDERAAKVREFYPKLPSNKFAKEHSYGIKDPDGYTAAYVKDLMDRNGNFGIIIGHDDLIQSVKLERLETAGYKLKQMFKDKYIAIGTTGNTGKITFAGELTPEFQKRNTRIYSELNMFKVPEPRDLNDNGSFQNYANNKFKPKTNRTYLKVLKDSDLSYYSSPEIMIDMTDGNKYNTLGGLDYVVYFKEVSPTNNLIVK
jgi:hypothetical protein